MLKHDFICTSCDYDGYETASEGGDEYVLASEDDALA